MHKLSELKDILRVFGSQLEVCPLILLNSA